MAKKYFLIIILFTNYLFANTIHLSDKYSIKKTLSGKLNKDLSLHLIFSINKLNKQYTLHPYLFSGKKIDKLPIIESKKNIEVISFHKKENIVSIFYRTKFNKNDFIKVTIDINSNKVLKSNPKAHKNFIGSFEEDGSSVLIYKNQKKLTVKKFSGIKENIYSYDFKQKNDDLKKFLNHKTLSIVKTDEFVLYGSTKKNKIYLTDNGLVLTKDDLKTLSTKILELTYDKKSILVNKKSYVLKKEDSISFKKIASYYSNKKLYQFALNKEFGTLQINDFQKQDELKNIRIDSSFNIKVKNYTNFKGVGSFLSKTYQKRNTPTITANKTIDNDYRIRFSFVNYYNSDINRHWWFFQQQQKLWKLHQRDFIQNAPILNGPNHYDYLSFNLTKTDVNEYSFEILIDKNGNISDKKSSRTIYTKINKDKYANKLKENKNYSLKSYCFTNNGFRYMVYSKKNKTIQLFNDKF